MPKVSIRKYSGLAFTYIENFYRLLYSFGFLVAAQHLLSVEQFSNFAFYVVVAAFVYGVSKFSIDAYAIKEFVGRPEQAIFVLRRLCLLRAGWTGIIVLLSIAILYFSGRFYPVLSLLVVLQFFRSIDIFELLLRAEERLLFQALVRMFSMIVVTVLVAFFLMFEVSVDVETLVFVQALEWGVVILIYSFSFFKCFGSKSAESCRVKEAVKKIVSGSSFVFFAFLLFLCYSKIDQLLLNWFAEAAEYGDYMIAARLVEASVVVVISLNMFFYPRLVRLYDVDRQNFFVMIKKISYSFLLVAGVVFLVVLALRVYYQFLPHIFTGLFSLRLIELLSWLAVSLFPVFLFGLRSSFFTIVDEPGNILLGSILGFAVSVLFGVPLIYFYGLYGGVACVLLTSVSSLLVSNFFSASGRTYLRLIILGNK